MLVGLLGACSQEGPERAPAEAPKEHPPEIRVRLLSNGWVPHIEYLTATRDLEGLERVAERIESLWRKNEPDTYGRLTLKGSGAVLVIELWIKEADGADAALRA